MQHISKGIKEIMKQWTTEEYDESQSKLVVIHKILNKLFEMPLRDLVVLLYNLEEKR